jgi:hypothetical protein
MLTSRPCTIHLCNAPFSGKFWQVSSTERVRREQLWLGICVHRVRRCTCNLPMPKNAPRDRAFHIAKIVEVVEKKMSETYKGL